MNNLPKRVAERLRDSSGTLRKEYGLRFFEEGDDLLLLPLGIKRKLPADFILTCINGNQCRASEADEDTRAGFVAYGVKTHQYENLLEVLRNRPSL